VELLTVGSGDNAVEQLVQADLAARGVRVEIRTREMGAFLAAARAERRTFDLLIAGIPGDLALSHLAAMFASPSAGGALDYAGFHRPALDAAFARAASATSGDARAAALRDAQRILADEMPAAWLYHSRGVQGVARSLGGVTMDLRGELATVTRWHRVGR
jgi:ABC-type transport system substrate-binding protein